MRKLLTGATAALTFSAVLFGQQGSTIVLPMTFHGTSDSLFNLILQQPMTVTLDYQASEMVQKHGPLADVETDAVASYSAPLSIEAVQQGTPAALTAVAGANFEGPGTGLSGFTLTGAPPDTTMAVGPNHIIAWVNSQFVIFDKAGNVLAAPANGSTLFASAGNSCATTNRGDPILQYDRLANRWILSQFAFGLIGNSPAAPYLQCFAVSQTNNPLGAWYLYSVTFSSTAPSGLNDYGKLGVWPDAYYTSYNMFQGSPAGAGSGAALCASDRTKMLAGDPTATTLCAPITFYAGGASFLPADMDGTTLPTDQSQGGMFIRQSTVAALRILKLKPNFGTSTVTITDGFGGAAGSFINLPITLNRACNGSGGTCVAQPGTTNTLDTLGDRLMYRAAYRNRAGIDSLVVNISADPDGAGARSAVVRWFEIRSPLTQTPSLYQNANWDPGAAGDRWMGSIAMDKNGNMLLGYSVANATTGLKPSLRVAGRLRTDIRNRLQGETTIITGTGSQTGTLTRWGDYTTMQVDPANDCTFWYIGQYLSADGTFNWRTRIASYKFPSCN